MIKSREDVKKPQIEEKRYWHLYSLQVLTPAKFVKVLGGVLNGRNILISTRDSEPGLDTTGH